MTSMTESPDHNEFVLREIKSLTTPHLADACIRIGIAVRCAPPSLRPVTSQVRFAGPAQPVRHTGSVDAILEAIGQMPPGAVLVIDDDARTDRACVGDLTVLEALHGGANAMVVNGLHRDTDELIAIGMPVFSLGASPTGPLEWERGPADALQQCRLGQWEVTLNDVLVGDHDGVIILPAERLDELVAAARTTRDREREQAHRARQGTSLRQQFGFDDYLARRELDPNRTFRQHLVERSASIEE
jgi:4-hydroxy-4-methyl-2-oxoglutarate aldolase